MCLEYRTIPPIVWRLAKCFHATGTTVLVLPRPKVLSFITIHTLNYDRHLFAILLVNNFDSSFTIRNSEQSVMSNRTIQLKISNKSYWMKMINLAR
ncbi:hypothetical protein TO66_30930 [Pseudomonas sp. MRSN 12121]|nr:hypothetical protein TO66_30930 [Pseudomonas sp. MRSN 12121]